MDAEDTQPRVELTAPGGFKGLYQGPLGTLAILAAGVAVVYGAFVLNTHADDAQKQSQNISRSVTEANKAIVEKLDQNNVAIVRSLERLIRVTRETACLNDPTMKNRADAREFCKRMSYDDDRYDRR